MSKKPAAVEIPNAEDIPSEEDESKGPFTPAQTDALKGKDILDWTIRGGILTVVTGPDYQKLRLAQDGTIL